MFQVFKNVTKSSLNFIFLCTLCFQRFHTLVLKELTEKLILESFWFLLNNFLFAGMTRPVKSEYALVHTIVPLWGITENKIKYREFVRLQRLSFKNITENKKKNSLKFHELFTQQHRKGGRGKGKADVM